LYEFEQILLTVEAETGVRGFIITGNDFLAPLQHQTSK
jgi:CHASE3 domain sensor protein